jgi:ABC-2 type transport system permease protein
MKQWGRIYLQAAKTAIASRMAYRLDYFLSLIIMLFLEMVGPMVTVLIYGTGVSFPGWSLYEALLIQAIFLLAKGIAFPFFFGMVWNTIRRAQEGTFDLLLIKPQPVLFMAIVTGFDAEDLGKLIGGTGLFIISISKLAPPSPFQWISFLIIFLFSLTVLFAFAVIMAATGMIWIGNFRLYEIFNTVTSFGVYPSSIFSKSVQILITYIIPIGMVGTLPASVLLGRPNPSAFAGMGISLVFLALSLNYWRLMMSRYTSAGG